MNAQDHMALSGIYEFEYTHQSEFCVAMYYSTQMVTLVLTMFLCVCIYISFLNRHIDVANLQFVIKERIIGQFLANSGTNIPSKLKKNEFQFHLMINCCNMAIDERMKPK